ncbi:hypothetical protein [Pontibacterium sp.]|uniref:hypothetical protein n=1 Tax=Pontibacterium sp. TaxID=2036026 RepID=UPI003512212C
MSLPKRNGLIRVMYGLSMIGMFVFLGNEAVSYASEPPAPAKAKAAEPVARSVAPETTAPNTLPIKQNKLLKVQGISTVLNLDGDVEAQINQHWLAFAESKLANSLPQSREVYAVYSDYDNKRNSVSLTLGFAKQGSVVGTVTATIDTGLYLPVSGKTVLESWQKPDLSAQSLRYETDYERWVLDKNYQPVRVTAHLGLR